MIDGRHLMGYTLYAVAGITVIVEQYVSWRLTRELRKKFPSVKRRSWLTWRPKQWPEMKDDPNYQALTRLHAVTLPIMLICFVGASWLLGPEQPDWLLGF